MKLIFSTITILYLCTFGTNCLAQENINQFDAQGKRTGVWKKYYNNKRIRYQGQFEHGKEVGVFRYYSAKSSKHPIAIKIFKKNSNQATVKFYTLEGVLKSQGAMEGKQRVGKWLYYHPDGKTVMSEENYTNGVLNGESKTYYKDGKVTEILHYKDGKLHGNLKRYASNGVLLDDLNYKDGKLNGLAKYYNMDGKLIYTGIYKDDVKEGKWEFYENGKPASVNKLKQ
ncbi:toxin-antitoxin system YwqK family antitoxin [Lutibacter sp.]